MKRVLALLAAIALCALCVLTFLPVPAPGQGRSKESKGKFRRVERAIPDHYIVVLRDDLPGRDVAVAAADLAGFHGGVTGHVYEHALKGFSVQLPEAAARALSQHPVVEYVEEDAETPIPDPPSVSPSGFLDGIYQPPTDFIYYEFTPAPTTQWGPSWSLDRIDQRDFSVPSASYTYTYTGAGVNVYVIDSGIRTTHQDFGGRASVAADFVGDGQNGQDCMGHGTMAASVIGGSKYGVAKGTRLHAVRVFGCTGGSPNSRTIAAVDWVTAHHIKPAVANMSLTGGGSDALDDAVRFSITSGVTYVVAAGNDNRDASCCSPARVAEALTVGATDRYDKRALFYDLYGDLWWGSNYGAVVDLFAACVNTTAAAIGSDTAITNGATGTSAAAPHVAGVAAQYLQANPGKSPAAVHNTIKYYATYGKVIDPGPGSPNKLLFSNFEMVAPSPTPTPTPTCNPADKEACEEFGGVWYASTCTCKSICFSKPWLCGY